MAFSFISQASVLNKMKTKFESQDEEKPLLLSKGVEKRKSVNPAAVVFEIKEQISSAESQMHTKPKPSETEWSWKKKAPQQLAMELGQLGYGYGNTPTEEPEKQKKNRRPKREFSEEEESTSEVSHAAIA